MKLINIDNINNIYIFSILSGILCSLSIPIFGLGHLIWFAIVPLLLGNTKNLFQSTKAGYSTGIILCSSLAYGIIPLSIFGFLAYTFVSPLFFVLFMIGVYYVKKCAKNEFVQIFAPPIFWVCLEYIFLNLLKIPLNFGVILYKHPIFLQVVSITGIYGISFLIILVNSTFALLLKFKAYRGRYVFISLGIVSLLFSLNLLYGFMVISKGDFSSANIKVVGLQGNIPTWEFDLSTIYPTYAKKIRNKYFNMSLEARRFSPKIIVFPKGATANYNFRVPKLRDKIYNLAIRTKSYLIIGSLDLDEKGKVYNSLFVVSPEGRLIGRYDKVLLAPGGEGIINPGSKYNIIKTEIGNFGPMICWESLFSGIARKAVNLGADVLIAITDDGSFRISALPYLHAGASVFRAIETRRYVVRVAQVGVSLIINPMGEILDKVELYNTGILKGNITNENKISFYNRFGDVFAFTCIFLTSVIFIATFLHRKDKESE